MESAGQARTRKKSIDTLVSRFLSKLSPGHSNGLPSSMVMPYMRRRHWLIGLIDFHPVELLVNITGPVLGIHTGPRALALCGYSED